MSAAPARPEVADRAGYVPSDEEWAGFPNPRLVPGLRRYFEERITPGSFLCAVLRNDLTDAVLRADDDNARLLLEIIRWLSMFAPRRAWGSESAFRAWVGPED